MTLSMLLDWSLYLCADRCFTELVLGVKDLLADFGVRKESSETLSLDTEDIRLSFRGDGDAYRRLIERHQDYVSRIMWHFSRDHRLHEELVQDVFVEAYLSLTAYRSKAPFAHWLARIATRVGYAYIKQSARRIVREGLTLKQWEQPPDDSSHEKESSEAAELLYRLLGQLPPRDRLILTLRYLEDCDIAETARRTGWSKSMVKVQTWRARKKLRSAWADSVKR